MVEPDYIILLGALAAEELYGTTCPIVVVEQKVYETISTGDEVDIATNGEVSVISSE